MLWHEMSPEAQTQKKAEKNIGDYEAYMTIPPDRGYAWVIALISFFGYLTVDGISFSFPVIREPLARHFEVSTTSAALVNSTFNSLSMFLGPLACSFSNQFGFRKIMIFGSLSTTMGILASYFCPNFMLFFLSYSILAGIGVGFCYVPATVPVGLWFDQHRPIALGLASSGTGIGMLMAYCISELLITFNWKYVIFLQAGLIGINIITSFFFRDLEPVLLQPVGPDAEAFRRRPEISKISIKESSRRYSMTAANYFGASQ